MTNKYSNTSTKLIATLLALFTLTGMAAASVSSITGDSADNVEIGNAATNLGQNTTFNFTIDHSSAFENVSLNISNAPNSDQISITGDGSDVYLNTSGVNVSDVYGPTSNVINISLGNQTAGAVDVSLTANLTHNVSGVNSEHSGVQYNLTNAGETDYGTVSFDYQDTVTPSVTGVTVRDNESSGDNIVNSSDSVYVEATVTDAGTGVDTVQVNNSDFFSRTSTVELTSKGGSDVYNASFDVGSSPSASDGSVSLTVKANDTAGNLNDSKSDSVTLDTTAPTYDSATTGNTTGGDTTRNKVVLSFTEATSGLDSGTVQSSDFAVEGSSLKVLSVSNVASDQVTLELNDTIQTDATPYVNLTGAVSDNAGNSVSSVDVEASDGLQAEVNSVETVDLGTDGDIDSVKVTYSEDVTNVGTDELNISGSNSADAKETSPGVVRYNLSSDVSGTSATPSITFSTSKLQDVAGNNLASTGIPADAADGASPVIVETITKDSDNDGNISKVDVRFSESVTIKDHGAENAGLALTDSAFTVKDNDYNKTGSTVTLNLVNEVSGTSATTSASYKVSDAGSVNATSPNQELLETTDQITETDGAAPVVTEFEVQKGSRRATVKFSEAVNAGSNTAVSSNDLAYTDSSGSSQEISSVSHIAGTDQATVILNSQVTEATGSDSIDVSGSLQDVAGNTGDSSSVTAADSRDQISLTKGWNLVSPAKVQKSSFGDSFTAQTVAAYDDGQWMSYETASSDGEMNAMYIKVSSPKELALANSNDPQDYPVTEDLEKGWNLVGVSSDPATNSSRAITNYLTGLSTGTGDTGVSKVIKPSGDGLGSGTGFTDAAGHFNNDMKTFQGYWVFMENQDSLGGSYAP